MKISITFEENRQEIPTDFEENSTGFNTEFGNFISIGGDGKSAYEIAVKNGFEGTEEEWLESLQGEDGKDGIDGISPIASIEDITGGHRVTITDKEGAKQFDVMDGKDGQGGGGGVTSWNDLEDRPFGEGETIEWKKIASNSTSQTGSVTSFTVYSGTSFTLTPGKNYKVVVYASMSGSRETIGVASKSTNITLDRYDIGSENDSVLLSATTTIGGAIYALNIALAEPIQSFMGISVTIYEEIRDIKPLDEKYIPNTIARVDDVPTNLSEFNNDAGYITAEDIPSGGVTSWNDLTDKPFKEEPEFNIQWDGDMTGRTVLDMSMLGYPQGMYFVKVSDDVFTTDEFIGCRYVGTTYDGGIFENEIDSDMIDTTTYPGAISLNGYVVIVHDNNTLATALGIPTGVYTNGIYFYLKTESTYISSLVSANTITKVDNEHLDMDSIITDVLNALPIYNGEVVAE